jgi:eukaryotic-like serine/threonine-protein kinase
VKNFGNDCPKPGARIDDFTVAYRIRRGMCADIFAVWHHRLRTPLICKRLRPSDAEDKKWRKHLRDEASALKRLSHPGIVRLFEYNGAARLPYLLIEHVGEETLRDVLLREKRLPVDFAIRIVQHTGAAVAYAHEQGFLHRDLKPSNIILRGGRPVLLDFGVVWRLTNRRHPPDRAGTPQYLAPEQIMREPLSPRTDVFGLGVLLFELLTGTRPFRASEAAHDRRASLFARYPQLTESPLTTRRAGRSIPVALEKVIARCLAFNSQDRFSDVPELLSALDSFTSVKVWPNAAIGKKACGRNDMPF